MRELDPRIELQELLAQQIFLANVVIASIRTEGADDERVVK